MVACRYGFSLLVFRLTLSQILERNSIFTLTYVLFSTYQTLCLCYLPKPCAWADNSDRKANRQIDSKTRQSETACAWLLI